MVSALRARRRAFDHYGEGLLMPAILIHGVPDTHHVWDGVRRRLTRTDVEAWDLPGFGTPAPGRLRLHQGGSTSTGSSSDLSGRGAGRPGFGHDWGCISTLRVACLRPDLVRNLGRGRRAARRRVRVASLAKIWQDPVEGDRYMADWSRSPSPHGLVGGFDVPADRAAR
ncbi:hypothetical protein [Streptomyces clavuligerus]|uniref:hypothetical protein n=1 Tax=Streptomyces clavuligerus TaxID=1901 RepID=UPI001F078D53|nr:hypothetical protein [Streptomyces clavuligerus]